jgi:preprotein translocase subunit SecG
VLSVLAVLQVLLSAAIIGLVLMHSGRDTGFGGLGFTRLTVVVGLIFAANTIALFYQL